MPKVLNDLFLKITFDLDLFLKKKYNNYSSTLNSMSTLIDDHMNLASWHFKLLITFVKLLNTFKISEIRDKHSQLFRQSKRSRPGRELALNSAIYFFYSYWFLMTFTYQVCKQIRIAFGKLYSEIGCFVEISIRSISYLCKTDWSGLYGLFTGARLCPFLRTF